MLPFPLLLAGAVMLFGAVTAAKQQRDQRKRLPRTPEPPPRGDTGWPWSKEWYCLVTKSPGSARSLVVGQYELTQSTARNWLLDHMEAQPLREWALTVWRDGAWRRTT